eukprot:scaffold447_cov307-Pinguiococcus_pyrenoidosus.AAC.11
MKILEQVESQISLERSATKLILQTTPGSGKNQTPRPKEKLLAEKEAEIAELRAQVKKHQSEVSDQIQVLEAARSTHAKELREAADEKSSILNELAELRTRAEELVVQEKAVATKEAEIRELRAQTEQQEKVTAARIEELEKTCSAQAQELKDAEEEKRGRDEELAGLRLKAQDLLAQEAIAISKGAEIEELQIEMDKQEKAAKARLEALEEECRVRAKVRSPCEDLPSAAAHAMLDRNSKRLRTRDPSCWRSCTSCELSPEILS